MTRPLSAGLLIVALMLAGCRATAPVAPGPAIDTVPADDNLNAVLWMQSSAEYQASSISVYRGATAQLDAALADPDWDALLPAERDRPAAGLPPAIVMDVDETVLDNSPYQARQVRDGSEYSDASWDAWVAERAATPVPGVQDFARAATAKGITILYLTNRTVAQREDTLANLRAHGLPVKDDSVFLGKGMAVADCPGTGSDKTCRRRLVSRQYRVLLQVGDQLSDFAAVSPNSTAARQQLLDRQRGWFGQRWWMLPNPSYGGWEAAAFDNHYDLPRDTRRAAKRRALRDSQ